MTVPGDSAVRRLADDARPLGVQLRFALQAMPHRIACHQGPGPGSVFFSGILVAQFNGQPTNMIYGDIIWI